jgi:hypothetical protein
MADYIVVGGILAAVVLLACYHFHLLGRFSALEESLKDHVKAEVLKIKTKL